MVTRAFSDRKWLQMPMAGDSRAARQSKGLRIDTLDILSPVSFLKAQPSIAIFLPVMLKCQLQRRVAFRKLTC